jgi:hypothetical protein
MATIGRLAVLIDADNSGLKAGLKDSVAQTEQSSKAIIKNVQAIASAFAGYLTVDMFAGMIKGAAEAGKQIDQLSKLSATSTTVFQQQAYAAQQFGISNEKLADIFKDVQDKVGDFMQNGAGPLTDFFNNIAPRVGVTADAFRNLSGPDALQLYVSSLEKANLTQSEMTFYLEAIASDSALLLPLLKNNGKAMKEMGDEAQKLGAVLSEETIKANAEFAAQLARMHASVTALKINIGSSLIPSLADASSYFIKVANDVGIARAMLISFGAAVAKATGTDEIGKFQSEAKAIGNAIKLTGMQLDRFTKLAESGVPGASKRVEELKAQMDGLLKKSAATSEQLKALANEAYTPIAGAALPPPTLPPTVVTPKPAAPGGTAKEVFSSGTFQSDPRDDWEKEWQIVKDQEDAKLKAQQEAFAKRIESLKEYTKTEEQLTLDRQAQQLKDLELGLEEGLLSEHKYMLMRQDMELKHMEELERIRKNGTDKLKDITEMSWNEQLALTVGKIGEMTAAAASGSKAMFNINKAAAIANALLKAKESVTSAYAFGSKIGGPPLGAAMAGLAAAATAAQIGAIRSQQFGGGGSVSAGGGSSTVPTQTAAASGTGMAQTITIQGVNNGDLFSGDAVRTLIDKLIDAQRNGARIVLA